MTVDGFANWGANILTEIPLTRHDRALLCRCFSDPNAEADYVSNYQSVFIEQSIPWTVIAVTQSASDACNLLIEYVGSSGRLYVEEGKMHASRGLLRPYGPLQNDAPRPGNSLVELFHVPRRGAADMKQVLQTKIPLDGDEDALREIRETLRPKSVVLLELITNTIIDGCVSGFFVCQLHEIVKERDGILVIDETLTCLRTGGVWASDHISDFRPDMLVFGKGMQICGLARPFVESAPPLDVDVTFPATAATLLKAKVVLREALGCINDESATRRMRDFVEARFEDVQGIGMVMAAKRKRNEKMPSYDSDEKVYMPLDMEKFSCTLLDDIYRFTFPLDNTKGCTKKRKRKSPLSKFTQETGFHR